MRPVILAFGIVAVLLIVAFSYIATTNVPLEQNTVSTTIPNDRFFDDK